MVTMLQDSWSVDLKAELQDFLSDALRSSAKPRLYEIYQAGTNEQGTVMYQTHVVT